MKGVTLFIKCELSPEVKVVPPSDFYKGEGSFLLVGKGMKFYLIF